MTGLRGRLLVLDDDEAVAATIALVAETSGFVVATASSTDPIAARDVLTRFRIKGLALSIDDFGTGHSTLVPLARRPFSELKIYRQFVGMGPAPKASPPRCPSGASAYST